jgi:ribose transport system permease protein
MNKALSRFVADYGMVFVLLLLCGYFSWATYAEQSPAGASGGQQVAALVVKEKGPKAKVLIVVRETAADTAFADAAAAGLGAAVVGVVKGQPPDLRETLENLVDRGARIDALACTQSTASWTLVQKLREKFPKLGEATVFAPRPYNWPNFLTSENLINVANRIAVIAIIAIGMTMVIITGGIDLSVGSLIALASVCAALLVQKFGGAEGAGPASLVLCSLGGIAVCAAAGLFSGAMVTGFGIPSFIVTLAMMLIASGAAYKLTSGESVGRLPDSFMWLGRGANLGLPNAVVLMAALYAVAHVIMSRTTLGRYIYAVGGNAEAARLSGVPVRRILLFVYTACGALAGLGGIITASLFKSGDPKYGPLAELYVIAAVVVGGTSLAGGEGKVLGTLIGALIIAVIENGMNLSNVESYTQKIVLGAVILGAVLLDTLKKKSWRRRERQRAATSAAPK